VTKTTTILGTICQPEGQYFTWPTSDHCTKLEVSSLNRSRDILGGLISANADGPCNTASRPINHIVLHTMTKL